MQWEFCSKSENSGTKKQGKKNEFEDILQSFLPNIAILFGSEIVCKPEVVGIIDNTYSYEALADFSFESKFKEKSLINYLRSKSAKPI